MTQELATSFGQIENFKIGSHGSFRTTRCGLPAAGSPYSLVKQMCGKCLTSEGIAKVVGLWYNRFAIIGPGKQVSLSHENGVPLACLSPTVGGSYLSGASGVTTTLPSGVSSGFEETPCSHPLIESSANAYREVSA